MEHCNIAITHVEPKLYLSNNEHEHDFNPTRYQRQIGSLRYLCNTRPYFAFSVEIVSRFMERPKVSHLKAAKRILRYFKDSIGCGILFPAKNKGKK